MLTFKSSNARYSGGAESEEPYRKFGFIMRELMPDNFTPRSVDDWNRIGIINHMVNKIMRYCNNLGRGGHQDSARDMIVYAAMLEALTSQIPAPLQYDINMVFDRPICGEPSV